MKKMLVFVSLTVFLTACSSVYYGTLSTFGVEKRQILVDRVEEVRGAQEKGYDQFRSALDQYRQVVSFDGGDLEERYDQLRDEYEDSKDAAESIRDRIDGVEEVADKLFAEWEEELEQYDNTALRSDSARKLEATRRDYTRLINAMHRSEERLDPALNAMHDQVLYLKHNLNASAIASLQNEANNVARDVDALLSSMQESIREADAFLAEL